jgi:hypothetical protein
MLARHTAADAGTRSNRFELRSSVDVRLNNQLRNTPQFPLVQAVYPEVQFHRNTTLPGREKIVRMGPDARPLPDWNVAYRVKGSGWMLLILLVKIIVNGQSTLADHRPWHQRLK